MLRFTLFGIPIVVEPWFWLTMAFLGGGLSALQRNYADDYLGVILFMMAGFVSVLVHELGHALTGWKRGGGQVWIRLWALGGLAYQQGGRLDRKNRCFMILAGPGAGLLLAAVSIASLFVIFPTAEAILRLQYYIRYTNIFHQEMVGIFPDNRPIYGFLNSLIWVNVWWSLLNLIPIFPLDGGQFIEQIIKSRKKMHQIGMIAGACCMLLLLSMGSIFGLLIFGFLTYQNYQSYKQASY